MKKSTKHTLISIAIGVAILLAIIYIPIILYAMDIQEKANEPIIGVYKSDLTDGYEIIKFSPNIFASALYASNGSKVGDWFFEWNKIGERRYSAKGHEFVLRGGDNFVDYYSSDGTRQIYEGTYKRTVVESDDPYPWL